MVNVLIVDDSRTARELFKHIVHDTDDLRVVGEATNGLEALLLAQRRQPDVILMDAIMPTMDGLEATRQIMEQVPTPIVVISSQADNKEANLAFRAIRAGALTVLTKPNGPGHADFAQQARKIQRTLRSMATVRVIHHRMPKTGTLSKPPSMPNDSAKAEVVGIVSSTGGPGALSRMLEAVKPTFPLPIVIVQHISADFLDSLVDWLNTASPLPVQLAQQNQVLQGGQVYVAPNDQHLRVTRARRFDLSAEPASLYRPSGDILLESLAEVYRKQAVGIIMTGMGEDGVVGLRRLYESGAMTIAQTEATSVVYGMPKAAIEQHIVRQKLSPLAMAGYLNTLVTVTSH